MSTPVWTAPALDHRYARDLPEMAVDWTPAQWPQARELWFNSALAAELGPTWSALATPARAAWLSGQIVAEGSRPVAQAYSGHQFGGFSPQLGDGRALLLGELLDAQGRSRDLALKGSGRTPFSRGGDGKAAVGPMLRELIMGEAMHALGVPTTRALAVVATGEPVVRDRVLPGAVLARVASSHLRVGTFEFAAARGDVGLLQRLMDHALARHDADLLTSMGDRRERAMAFLTRVVDRQARLVAHWMSLGFIHGVMNTDNMTISGETIDYGPCAFMEGFDPGAVFSSIDRNGRYAWGRQPAMAQWNLARLAESLLPLIDEDGDRAIELATPVISGFADVYGRAVRLCWRAKLGLSGPVEGVAEDAARVAAADGAAHASADDAAHDELAQDWLSLLQAHRADFTRAWRSLVQAWNGDEDELRRLIPDETAVQTWLQRWRHALQGDPMPVADRHQRLHRANPVVIPRNHLVEAALAAATDDDDLEPLRELMAAVSDPWNEALWTTRWAQPAAAEVTACYKTFCGT